MQTASAVTQLVAGLINKAPAGGPFHGAEITHTNGTGPSLGRFSLLLNDAHYDDDKSLYEITAVKIR